MKIQYGSAPKDLGHVDVPGQEMMMYVYLPVAIPGSEVAIPARLSCIDNLVSLSLIDATMSGIRSSELHLYVTMKRMWVEAGAPGNRPGWHADGYGSGGDLNYIWSDMNPTEFAVQRFVDIPDDDLESIAEMERQVDPDKIVTYPDRHLLRLDESVVHRVNPNPSAGVRTFVKISASRHRYNLQGNSKNYLLDYDWEMHPRFERRNIDNKDFVPMY